MGLRYLYIQTEDKRTFFIDEYAILDDHNRPVMVPGENGKLTEARVKRTRPMNLGKTAKKKKIASA